MNPRITIIIPNWNRRQVLRETLSAISGESPDGVEVLVVDNASSDGAADMVRREFGFAGLIRLRRNVGTAARNVGLKYARAPLTLMLDNDSHPLPGALARIEPHFRRDPLLGALGGRILVRLRPATYEAGGLPGVFVGCGAAFRTAVLREVGGYPEDYGFYVEEYDVSCRLWQAGWRVEHAGDVPILHRKVAPGRDMNQILRRLVRNNLRLWRRFSPPQCYWAHQRETISRYFRVACKESATAGYWRGLVEGLPDLLVRAESCRPLDEAQHAALFGLDRARQILARAIARYGRGRVALFGADKGLPQVLGVLAEAGVSPSVMVEPQAKRPGRWRGRAVVPPAEAGSLPVDWAVVGSLSPGNAENLRSLGSAAMPGTPMVKLCRYLANDRGGGPTK